MDPELFKIAKKRLVENRGYPDCEETDFLAMQLVRESKESSKWQGFKNWLAYWMLGEV